MPKLTTKKSKKSDPARLELRISEELQKKVRDYGEQHLENMSEVIVNAIKQTIGFQNVSGAKMIPASEKTDTGDEKKKYRLSLRIHPMLKDALNKYAENQECTLSQVVIFGLKQYIKDTN